MLNQVFDEIQSKLSDIYDRVSQLEAAPTVPSGGGGGSAPADAYYLVNAADATLTNEIVVTATIGSLMYGNPAATWDVLAHPTTANNVLQTTTVPNSVTWSANTLAITGNSTINGALTGGGTVATAGFTITAPATGTIALGAGTVTSATINDATIANHVHALNATGVVAATYGSATQVGQFAVDTKGRITTALNVAISGVPPAAHNLLSIYHGDTVINAVTRGSIVYGDSTPSWNELVLSGISGSVLTRNATDVLWSIGALSFSGAFTLTIPATGTAVLGTGASPRIAYWSGNNTLSSDAGLTVDAANDLIIVADDGGIGIANGNEKLEFFTAGYAVFSGCNVGINEASPDELLHITSSTSAKPVLLIENTNEDNQAPILKFYKNSISPADNDDIGAIDFYGEDSAGNLTRYGYILAESLDVTDTDESGGLRFEVRMDNTYRSLLNLFGYNGVVNQGEVTINDEGQDVDFYVEAVGVNDAIFIRGSDGQTTLGVLTAGYVNSDANGVLSVTATAVATPHNILSTTHSDAATDAVTRGSIIYGNPSPAWDELVLGGISGSLLTRDANDVLWSTGALSFAGAFTLTIPATGTAALGTGANARVAFWTGTNTLSSDAQFTFSTADNSLTVDKINLADTSNQAVFQSAGVTGTLTWTPTLIAKTITLPDFTGTVVLGTGTTNRVTYFGGTNWVTSDANFTFNPADNSLTIDKLYLADTSNQIVFQSAGVTGTLTWTPVSSNKTITLPNATGTVTLGTGTATQIAYWSATNTITGDAGLTIDATNDMIIVANGGGIGISNAAEKLEFFTAGYAAFSNCDVGISTTAPQVKLDIIGSGFNAANRVTDVFVRSGAAGSGNYVGSIGFQNAALTTCRAAIAGVQETVDADHVGLAFFTHPSGTASDPLVEAVRIDKDGKVGIGITTPDGTLHVHTATAGAVTPSGGADDLVVENSGNGGISIITPDASAGQLIFGSPSDATGALFNWQHSTLLMRIGTAIAGGILALRYGNGNEGMRISSAGNVLIGTTTDSGYRLDIDNGAFRMEEMTAPGVSANAVVQYVVDNAAVTEQVWKFPDASTIRFITGSHAVFTGDVTCNNLTIADYILHTGEVGNDTYIRLQEDQVTTVAGLDTYIDMVGDTINVVVGGAAIMDLVEAATDYVEVFTDLRMNNQKFVGINGDVRISFDSTSGNIDAILDDTSGADEFRVLDSALVPHLSVSSNGVAKIGGTAVRGTVEGTKHLDIFDGASPTGTLANGISLYSSGGECYVIDAAGNATLLSPHDENNNWIFKSTSNDGKLLKIEVEKLLRFVNSYFGLNFILETK